MKLAKGISKDYKHRYIDLFKKYSDVFAWSYKDLKTYDTNTIHHKIPLKKGVKSYKQKLRHINPPTFAFNREGSEEIIAGKNNCHIEVLRLGCQFSTSEEEKWRDRVMHIFQKSE